MSSACTYLSSLLRCLFFCLYLLACTYSLALVLPRLYQLACTSSLVPTRLYLFACTYSLVPTRLYLLGCTYSLVPTRLYLLGCTSSLVPTRLYLLACSFSFSLTVLWFASCPSTRHTPHDSFFCPPPCIQLEGRPWHSGREGLPAVFVMMGDITADQPKVWWVR